VKTTASALSHPWTRAVQLRCAICGEHAPPGPSWTGCQTCRGPLVVDYSAVEGQPDDLLPVPAPRLVPLGQGRTPLVRYGDTSAIWLKLEGQNPTGSHKDRFHALSIAIARELGYRDVVTSSTGNHGAACAAYAARAGLRCLVMLHQDSPAALRTQIRCAGGEIAVVPGHETGLLGNLVDAGWYPSTSADPALAGRANPYGQEAYKAIAHEIVAGLGGQPPASVAVPAASGDTLYGIWRGFRDLHERSDLAMPVILACQPAWTAPLVTSWDGARPAAPGYQALALSASDPQTGRHARLALEQDGVAIPVPEGDLVAALRELSAEGFVVEPASALTLAGLKLALADGLTDATGPAVCVLTSSGLNWTRDLDAAWEGVPHVLDSPAAVLSHAGLNYVTASAATIAASATAAGSAGGTGPHGDGAASMGREARLVEQRPPHVGTGAPPP
jgi:threonine synthase